MAGCCRLPFGTAGRSVRVLLKVPYLHYFSPLPRPSLDEKTRSVTVPDLKAHSTKAKPNWLFSEPWLQSRPATWPESRNGFALRPHPALGPRVLGSTGGTELRGDVAHGESGRWNRRDGQVDRGCDRDLA